MTRSTWPAAVLLDMDGTLVDTEPYWIEAEHQLVTEHGGTWTHDDAMALVGSDLLDSGLYIREHGGVDLEPVAIVEWLIDQVVVRMEEQVPWRPGAVELLETLTEAGVPTALVTMSWRRLVDPFVAGVPAGSFTAVVTGDEVARGKPHPDPYLAAARELGVAPEDTLAVEDSSTGTASAAAAGCTVLVVPNHVTVPPGERRVFRDSLAGLSLADLAGLRREAFAEL